MPVISALWRLEAGRSLQVGDQYDIARLAQNKQKTKQIFVKSWKERMSHQLALKGRVLVGNRSK